VAKWISFQLTILARPSVPIWWKVSLTNPCHIGCDFRHWTSCGVGRVATVDALFRCDRTSTYSDFKSVVIGILTRLRVGDRRIFVFSTGFVFLPSRYLRTGCAAHPVSCSMGTRSNSPGGKGSGREADYSLPSGVEVKTACICGSACICLRDLNRDSCDVSTHRSMLMAD